MKKSKSGICVYCGEERTLTDDHIPPKLLFAPDDRSDTIKVPSCSECNSGASKDDEYFRAMLVMRDGVSDHPGAQQPFATMNRSFLRPEQLGLRRATARNITEIEDWSGGIYRGRRHAYKVDLQRCYRVVARIVRGMYWHRHAESIPDDFLVQVFSVPHGLNLNLQASLTIHRLYKSVLSHGINKIGHGVFEYSYADTEVRGGTAWVMRFYESFNFLALTIPISEDERLRRRLRLKQELNEPFQIGLFTRRGE